MKSQEQVADEEKARIAAQNKRQQNLIDGVVKTPEQIYKEAMGQVDDIVDEDDGKKSKKLSKEEQAAKDEEERRRLAGILPAFPPAPPAAAPGPQNPE